MQRVSPLSLLCGRPVQCDRAGRHWFWLLLPKQKWLGSRDEPRAAIMNTENPSLWILREIGCFSFRPKRKLMEEPIGQPRHGYPAHRSFVDLVLSFTDSIGDANSFDLSDTTRTRTSSGNKSGRRQKMLWTWKYQNCTSRREC